MARTISSLFFYNILKTTWYFFIFETFWNQNNYFVLWKCFEIFLVAFFWLKSEVFSTKTFEFIFNEIKKSRFCSFFYNFLILYPRFFRQPWKIWKYITGIIYENCYFSKKQLFFLVKIKKNLKSENNNLWEFEIFPTKKVTFLLLKKKTFVLKQYFPSEIKKKTYVKTLEIRRHLTRLPPPS